MSDIDGVVGGEVRKADAAAGSHDEGCICRGNWRLIVGECSELIGKRFASKDGGRYRFFGVVHGDDDDYYGMHSSGKGLVLLSCVGSLESHGFEVSDVDQPEGVTEDRHKAMQEKCAEFVLKRALECPEGSAARAALESVGAVLGLYGPDVFAAKSQESAGTVEDECTRCGGSGDGRAVGGSGPDAHEVAVNCERCQGTGACDSRGSGKTQGVLIGDMSTPANRLATLLAEGLGSDHPAMQDLAMVLLGDGFKKG